MEAERGLLLFEGEPDEHDWAKCAVLEAVPRRRAGAAREVLGRRDEREQGAPAAAPRLVTYNGRSYDGPTLMIRSAQLYQRLERTLLPLFKGGPRRT